MKKIVAAFIAGIFAGLALAVPASGPVKRVAKRALDRWNSRQRYAMRSNEPPFTRLAVSQVGYAPSMRKQFTAPHPFQSFRVVSEGDGKEVFAGRAPVRTVQTDLLGTEFPTVWIGDFSALTAPGRYRIVDDRGASSFPFDVRADVYDATLRAVQRWVYYQRAFTEIDRAHAEGPWVHKSDADKAPPGVRAGWHDAGDFTVYSASLNTAVFWLLETWSDFHPAADDTNIPESGNGVPDLLDETRWGLEWLLSVQDASGSEERR